MSKTFCTAPWTNYMITPRGVGYICCRHDDPRSDLSWPVDRREELKKSPQMLALKEAMLTGQPVAACNNCYIRESEGNLSLRQIFNSNMEHLLDKSRLSDPDYELLSWFDLSFSNKCNQKCRICGPSYSTGWFKDAALLSEQDPQLSDFFGKYSYTSNEDDIPNIINKMEQSPIISSIECKGGEPLYSEGFKTLLTGMVDRKIHEKVKSLTIITNGTIHDDSILDLIKQFNHVTLMLSIDGTEQLYNYTRGTSISWDDCRTSWNKIFKVVDSLPSKKFLINNVVYIYTAFEQEKLHSWVKSEWGDSFYLQNSTLFNPSFLNVNILDHDLLDAASNKTNSTKIKNIFNTAKSSLVSKNNLSYEEYRLHLVSRFKNFTLQTDRIRNENILDLVPELKSLWA